VVCTGISGGNIATNFYIYRKIKMTEIKKLSGYQIEGVDKVFSSRKEVEAYLRRPKIKEALDKLTKDAALTSWLIENAASIESAFETGAMRRITKVDAKKIETAIEAIKASKLKGTEFLIEIWPEVDLKYKPVKRMTDSEKELTTRNSIQAIEGGTEELAVWVIATKDAILAAYQAGIVKRPIPEALVNYRKNAAAAKVKVEADEDEIIDQLLED